MTDKHHSVALSSQSAASMQDDGSGSRSRRTSSSTRRHTRGPSRSSLLESSADYLEEARQNWPAARLPRRELPAIAVDTRPKRRSTTATRKLDGVDRAKNKVLATLPEAPAAVTGILKDAPPRSSSQSPVRRRALPAHRDSLASHRSRVPSLPDSDGWDEVLSEHETVARSIQAHKSSFSLESPPAGLSPTSSTKPTLQSQCRELAWHTSARPAFIPTQDSGLGKTGNGAHDHRRHHSDVFQTPQIQRAVVPRKPVPRCNENGSLLGHATKKDTSVSAPRNYTALFVPKVLTQELPSLNELTGLQQLEQLVLLAGFLSIVVVDSQANMQTHLNRLSYLSEEHRARTEAIKRNEDRVKRLQKDTSDAVSIASKDSQATLTFTSRWFSKKHRRASESAANGPRSVTKTIGSHSTLGAQVSIEAMQHNTAHHVDRLQAIATEKAALQTKMKDSQARFGEIISLESALREYLVSSNATDERGTDRTLAVAEDQALSVAVKQQKETTMRCRQHERRYAIVIECEDHLSEAIVSTRQVQDALASLGRSVEARVASVGKFGAGKARLITQKELKAWQAAHENCRDRWSAAWSCIEFNFRCLRTKATALLHADASVANGNASVHGAGQIGAANGMQSARSVIYPASKANGGPPSSTSTHGRLLRIQSQPDLRGTASSQHRATFDPEVLSEAYRGLVRQGGSRPQTATVHTPPARSPVTSKRLGSKDSTMSTYSFHTAAGHSSVEEPSGADDEVTSSTNGGTTNAMLSKKPDTVHDTWSNSQTSLLSSILTNVAATSSTSTLLSLLAPPLFPPVGVHMDFVRHYQGLLASLETSLSALRGMWDELILKWEEHGDYLGERVVDAMKKTDLVKMEYWTQVGAEVVRDILRRDG